MGPQPLQLSMGPQVHFCSSVCQLFAQLGVLDMTVLLVRGMTAAAGSWVYDGTGCEVQQAFVFPDPGPVIPIIFARLRTVGHDEGGGVGGFACVPELKHVFIRSEERRVGKERRSRWESYDEEKKLMWCVKHLDH